MQKRLLPLAECGLPPAPKSSGCRIQRSQDMACLQHPGQPTTVHLTLHFIVCDGVMTAMQLVFQENLWRQQPPLATCLTDVQYKHNAAMLDTMLKWHTHKASDGHMGANSRCGAAAMACALMRSARVYRSQALHALQT